MKHIDHSCRVCGAFGMYGIGVQLLKNKPGEWFCSAHKPAAPPPAAHSPSYNPHDHGRLF